MTQKVHGFAATPDQFLTGGLPMFTATVTGADLTALVGDEEQHAPALDKLIEVISIRAQPVIMGKAKATTLNFAVEHNEIFGDLTAFGAEATAAFAAKFPGATVSFAKFVF
jgi:hypothetical protein